MRKPGVVEAGRCGPGSTAPDRAEVAHWRALAGARSATLDALTQRPLVRLAVRLDQRLAPLTRRVSSGRRRFGAAVDRSALLVAGAGSRPALPRRRRRLARELDQLPPPAVAPSVSVITLAHWTDLPVPSAGTTAPQVVVAEPGPSRVAALANATTHATGEVVCFLPEPTDAPDPAWLARLAAGIGGDVVAATPTLIHPSRRGRRAGPSDLLVRSAGYELEIGPGGGPLLRSRGHGAPPDVGAHPSEVVAAPLHGLAVARTALVDAGGLLDATDDDAAAVDLIARLRARGGQVRHVPSALAYDHRPVTSRRSLEHPIDPAGPAWASVVDRWGPALVRSAAEVPAPTSWAVTTAVPSARVAERWGDWHFAQALARSLRQVGHHVVVQRLDEADSAAGRSCDLHLVLHGLGAVRRTTGQGHVLWVISHPETVTTEACDDADLVLVASASFAAHLRERTATPVEVLLQATDQRRFRPVAPRPEYRHDVTVVAKTRDVLRPIVADAIAAGIRPAVYGGGWRSLIDPALVIADHLDNRDLPAVYCSAGVVLNDHWDTMRAWGFVSNRLFDVLACGAPVISDPVDGLSELFGDAVVTYRTADDLRALVAAVLDDPDAARARVAAGRAIVLAHHTFDHRAEALTALVERHLRCNLTRMEPQP